MAEKVAQKKWYVLKVKSGTELRVLEAIKQDVQRNSLSHLFGDILVPSEEVVEMRRSGKKRKSDRKFFPGYILIQMEMTDDAWHLVRNIDGVAAFVGGTSSRPTPITDAEAESVINRMQESTDKPKPKVLFEPGEVIRVIDGPFTDFNGVVEEVNYEKSRLKVAVLIFGRSTPVDLGFSQVQKS